MKIICNKWSKHHFDMSQFNLMKKRIPILNSKQEEEKKPTLWHSLRISVSAMDDDYDSQESQNIDINDDIGDDPIHVSMEENLCDVEYNKPLNEVCAAQKYRRTGPIIRYLQEAALPTY